jgi:hypothetical protein
LLAVAVVVVLVAVAGAVVAVTKPFAANGPANTGVSDNAYPISYTTVQRQDLQSQTEVQGTLTYANADDTASATSVVLPAGTAPSTIEQAEETVVSAKAALSAATVALQATQVSNAKGMVQADQSVQAAQAALA